MDQREHADHEARLRFLENEMVVQRKGRHDTDNLAQGAVSGAENALQAVSDLKQQVRHVMTNSVDQQARDMIAELRAAQRAHEAVCTRIEQENRDWRGGMQKMMEEMRNSVTDFVASIGDRSAKQSQINSDLYLKNAEVSGKIDLKNAEVTGVLKAPNQFFMRVLMATNAALFAAVIALATKLVWH